MTPHRYGVFTVTGSATQSHFKTKTVQSHELASRSNASGAPKIPETLPAYVRRIQPVTACSHSCTYVFLMSPECTRKLVSIFYAQ